MGVPTAGKLEASPRRRLKTASGRYSLHLDVAALDVATAGVEGVRAQVEIDGEEVRGELPARARRLTLVAHQNGELTLLERSGKRGVLGPVGALEQRRRNALELRRGIDRQSIGVEQLLHRL